MADILERINNLVNRHYRPVWDSSNRSEAFRLCNYIRAKTGVPEYRESKFDEGFQYRIIFHEDYKVAKDEFVNLVFGWW